MDDVGLQRAIINSLTQVRGAGTPGAYNGTTYYRNPPRTTLHGIAPTIPAARPSPNTRRLGHRNQLEREGIAPAVTSSQTYSRPSASRQYSDLLARSKTTSVLSKRRNSRLAEDDGDSSSISGWTGREPIDAGEREQITVEPQNPSGSIFSLESPPEAFACCILTYDGAEEFVKKASFMVRCSVKLTSLGSELFFIVLDYKQRGRETGSFVSVSFSLLSKTWRIERYSKGERKAVFCECVDQTLKLNTWLELRCIVRSNGNRVSLFNRDQQIFKQVDVSQGATNTPGHCGLGVFHAKAIVKDWQVSPVETVGNTTGPPVLQRTGSAPLARTGAGRATTSRSIAPNGDCDSHLASIIEKDIMNSSPGVTWESIAALEDAKRLLNEAVVLPLLIPEFFTGIREPWKGVLLFGPPGTGKTMLAKAVATCANTTFFNCSASSLVSKYHGESERLVKALFQAARQHAPSTIFFDEIDALMMSRGSSTEHEASRRLKSELLSQIDGMNSSPENGLVMVLATSNKPWDLDEALRRRLEKRIYIPLPDARGRYEMFRRVVAEVQVNGDVDIGRLAQMTEGYSGADIHQVCRDACMMPMRQMVSSKSPQEIKDMRDAGLLTSMPVRMQDFLDALRNIRPSVAASELRGYVRFQEEFGSL